VNGDLAISRPNERASRNNYVSAVQARQRCKGVCAGQGSATDQTVAPAAAGPKLIGNGSTRKAIADAVGDEQITCSP
jgi:hypothetical protein